MEEMTTSSWGQVLARVLFFRVYPEDCVDCISNAAKSCI